MTLPLLLNRLQTQGMLTNLRIILDSTPIQEVAAILGHEKLDTTMKYVVLDKTDIKNSYRKYA